MKTSASTSKTESNASFHISHLNKENKPAFFSQKDSGEMFFGPATLQPKLEIGQPDDKYEREADRVADQVMRMPDPAIQKFDDEDDELQMKRKSAIQMKCDTCKHEEELQRKPLIQRKADNSQAVSSELSQKIYSVKGSGHSLPNKTQQEMGAKIGADFNRVRVHTGSNAIQLNRELGARAFTVGNDIFFNKGQYNPNSGEGKRLMAHELVHTVQQNGLGNNLLQRNGGPIVSGIRNPDEIGRRREAPSVVEVTVIDISHFVGKLAALTRLGEVYMDDVESMVDNVLGSLEEGQRMSRLNILDHGNENSIQIGNERIFLSNVSQFESELSRLNGHFTANGFVHLQHCRAGQNTDLMAALAAIFGVPVYAGTELQNPVYRANYNLWPPRLGEYVRVDPDGTIHPDVGRP
jgi:hypothetical protein